MKIKTTIGSIRGMVVVLVLSLALLAAITLVGKRQETRRGAYFAGSRLLLMPETVTKRVGEDVPVQLLIETQNGAKVDAVETRVCPGAGVGFADTSSEAIEERIALSLSFTNILKSDWEEGCLVLSVKSERAASRLSSGMVSIATIRFVAKAAGQGDINIVKEGSVASGFNPNSTDLAIEVNEVRGLSYVIEATDSGCSADSQCGWCGLACMKTPPVTSVSCVDVAHDPALRCGCVSGQCRITQVLNPVDWRTDRVRLRADDFYIDFGGRRYLAPIEGSAFQIHSDPGNPNYTTLELRWSEHGKEMRLYFYFKANAGGWWSEEFRTYNNQSPADWIYYTGRFFERARGTPFTGDFEKVSSDGLGRVYFKNLILETFFREGVSPTVQPTVTVQPEAAVLKFRMAFRGVGSGSGCAVGWPVQIMVLGSGESAVYSATPVRVESITDRAVYEAMVNLANFSQRENLAVFIKGPRHLQVKYGVNNQVAFYNRAGGQIRVGRADDPNIPVYDFSGYPVLAGDVVGESSVQDGVVDGRDFSFIKRNTDLRVQRGGDMRADLNGNCDLSSTDTLVFMQSLVEKQSQMY